MKVAMGEAIVQDWTALVYGDISIPSVNQPFKVQALLYLRLDYAMCSVSKKYLNNNYK